MDDEDDILPTGRFDDIISGHYTGSSEIFGKNEIIIGWMDFIDGNYEGGDDLSEDDSDDSDSDDSFELKPGLLDFVGSDENNVSGGSSELTDFVTSKEDNVSGGGSELTDFVTSKDSDIKVGSSELMDFVASTDDNVSGGSSGLTDFVNDDNHGALTDF
jgi:hypothetical protein